MFNNDGVKKSTLTGTSQILANVGLQASVGCIVPASLGVAVDTRTIAKAGTPIVVDLMNLQTAATAGATGMNAVLLHDVDVTDGPKNGTALIFGFVNVNRCETDVQTLLAAATPADACQVTLLKA